MAYPEVPELKPFAAAQIPNIMLLGPYDTTLKIIMEYLNTLGVYIDEQDAILQQQIDALDERLTQAEADIDALEERMDTAETDIDNLETRMDTAETDIDNLETRMDTAESDIDNLETRMDTAETDIDNLETRMDTAESDIDNLETRMDTAETDIDNLETRMDTAETDIDNLETRMDTAESDIDNLETRMDTAETDIDNLESSVETINTNITEITGDISEINTTIETMGVVLDSKLDKPAAEGTAGQYLQWDGEATVWADVSDGGEYEFYILNDIMQYQSGWSMSSFSAHSYTVNGTKTSVTSSDITSSLLNFDQMLCLYSKLMGQYTAIGFSNNFIESVPNPQTFLSFSFNKEIFNGLSIGNVRATVTYNNITSVSLPTINGSFPVFIGTVTESGTGTYLLDDVGVGTGLCRVSTYNNTITFTIEGTVFAESSVGTYYGLAFGY